MRRDHLEILMIRIFEHISTVQVLVLMAVLGPTAAIGAEQPSINLSELSFEELMAVEITSVSKKEEKLFEAAAAVYVITQEDIRRSGVTSIPEALRMVPGLQVARIDANKWAITSRGFNSLLASKLLVLMDGRSIYTPLFSGVYWETHDVVLEDVERIEVIRGPGATLWGANAVNGVINILTKNARDTQGSLVTLGAGSEERGFVGVRYGGTLGDGAHYRTYAKYFNRDRSVDASGRKAMDEWAFLRGGFRIDWAVSDEDRVMVGGDAYDGDAGQIHNLVDAPSLSAARRLDFEAKMAAANVQGRWEHVFSEASDLAIQLYYDRTTREEAVIEAIIHTFDLDVQHRFRPGSRQEIVWGGEYRFTSDQVEGTFNTSFAPESRKYHLVSAFLQDEITLIDKRLLLTLGSKLEHNDYTGFEAQPDARLLWTSGGRHTAWGALARAVRTPSRAEEDIRIVLAALPPGVISPDIPRAFLILFGNRGIEAEELLALELGYRTHPTDRLLVDVAAFRNLYEKLRTMEPGASFVETSPRSEHVVLPYVMDNKMDGETYGAELAVDWRARDGWRLNAAYTYLKMELDLDGDSGDTMSEALEGGSPRHQLRLRSSMDLPGDLGVDLSVRYVDGLPALNVPSYMTFDVRLSWQILDSIEISLAGQNLIEDHYTEFRPEFPYILSAEAERGVYSAITWRF